MGEIYNIVAKYYMVDITLNYYDLKKIYLFV